MTRVKWFLIGFLLATGAFLLRDTVDAYNRLSYRVLHIEQFLAAATGGSAS